MSGHNLNVESYSFHELCGLFHLEPNNVTLDDLKRAKKQVLMTHPDKSKLDPSYFLFYKRAFDIIMRMYENVHSCNIIQTQSYIHIVFYFSTLYFLIIYRCPQMNLNNFF